MSLELVGALIVVGVFICNSIVLISLFMWNRLETIKDNCNMNDSITLTQEFLNQIQKDMKEINEKICALEKEK